MIEKFEDRKLTGLINVACKFDDGTVRYWNADKEEVIENIVRIVEEYEAEGYTLTLRQLHYQFVGHVPGYVNHDTAYKRLGGILDDCRYGGLVDWEAFEDRGRVPYIPYSVENVEDALQDAIRTYRIDRQLGQKIAVEVWTEKDALSGILKRVTEKYHVRLSVNKGYTSSSAIYNAYRRIISNVLNEKYTVILYVGDHDPSGLDMFKDIEKRLSLMLREGEYSVHDHDDVVKVAPIALTMEQVKRYKLPNNPTKLTDTRCKRYIQKYGRTCWELDALRPQVLIEIVESAVKQLIDIPLYQQRLLEEADGIAELKDIVNNR